MQKERVSRALDALRREGIAQLLISDPMSIYYFTDVYVEPHERFFGLLLRADGRHSMFLNRLFTISKDAENDADYERLWLSDTDDLSAALASCIDSGSVLGVDKDIRARFLLPLMEKRAASGFVNGSLAVDLTRAVKDEAEIRKMREASRINDKAMMRFKQLVREGITEAEIEEKLPGIYRELGAEDYSFEPIVSFGKNAADPHHSPDGTALKEGEAVLFDVGCKKDGYCSDMTRTFCFRRADEGFRRLYELVRRANEAAEALIRPGVRLCELDRAARSIIEEAGYGPYFNHRLGHFIGLSVHEYGDVSSAFDWELRPGMIFSIEPGIYLPGDTGVRIEDLVLVTEDGAEILNTFPHELEIIG